MRRKSEFERADHVWHIAHGRRTIASIRLSRLAFGA